MRKPPPPTASFSFYSKHTSTSKGVATNEIRDGINHITNVLRFRLRSHHLLLLPISSHTFTNLFIIRHTLLIPSPHHYQEWPSCRHEYCSAIPSQHSKCLSHERTNDESHPIDSFSFSMTYLKQRTSETLSASVDEDPAVIQVLDELLRDRNDFTVNTDREGIGRDGIFEARKKATDLHFISTPL